MKQRVCDVCDIVITTKDYIKLQLIKHEGKTIKYLGIGDMCLNCWEKTK